MCDVRRNMNIQAVKMVKMDQLMHTGVILSFTFNYKI